MKPGNLRKRGAKSGGNTKDEDSIGKRIESSMRLFLWGCLHCSVREWRELWKKDYLLLNV